MDQPTRTLKEANEALARLKHRLSVWEAVHDWLDKNFIGKDGRQTKSLRSPGAVPDVVPEETFEEVLQFIGEAQISELMREIAALEGQHVVVVREAK